MDHPHDIHRFPRGKDLLQQLVVSHKTANDAKGLDVSFGWLSGREQQNHDAHNMPRLHILNAGPTDAKSDKSLLQPLDPRMGNRNSVAYEGPALLLPFK